MEKRKYKTLWDSKIGEFAMVEHLMGQYSLFTSSNPRLLPETATLEDYVDYYKDKANIDFEFIKMINIEINFDIDLVD